MPVKSREAPVPKGRPSASKGRQVPPLKRDPSPEPPLSESESLSSLSSQPSESPSSPKPKTRGRPKTLETYDSTAYSKRFREKAAPYHCDACNVEVSYFSKTRHLATLKHKRNAESQR